MIAPRFKAKYPKIHSIIKITATMYNKSDIMLGFKG